MLVEEIGEDSEEDSIMIARYVVSLNGMKPNIGEEVDKQFATCRNSPAC